MRCKQFHFYHVVNLGRTQKIVSILLHQGLCQNKLPLMKVEKPTQTNSHFRLVVLNCWKIQFWNVNSLKSYLALFFSEVFLQLGFLCDHQVYIFLFFGIVFFNLKIFLIKRRKRIRLSCNGFHSLKFFQLQSKLSKTPSVLIVTSILRDSAFFQRLRQKLGFRMQEFVNIFKCEGFYQKHEYLTLWKLYMHC